MEETGLYPHGTQSGITGNDRTLRSQGIEPEPAMQHLAVDSFPTSADGAIITSISGTHSHMHNDSHSHSYDGDAGYSETANALGDRAISSGLEGVLEPRKPRARTMREKMVSLRLGAQKCAEVMRGVHRSLLLVAFTKWHRASDGIGEQQRAAAYLKRKGLSKMLGVITDATERLAGWSFWEWYEVVNSDGWDPFAPNTDRGYGTYVDANVSDNDEDCVFGVNGEQLL